MCVSVCELRSGLSFADFSLTAALCAHTVVMILLLLLQARGSQWTGKACCCCACTDDRKS